MASKIFTKEAHMLNEPGMEVNISYRFGDPIQLADDSYKYPELVEYFTKTGESYDETLSLIFNSVLEMSGKYNKLMVESCATLCTFLCLSFSKYGERSVMYEHDFRNIIFALTMPNKINMFLCHVFFDKSEILNAVRDVKSFSK